MMKALFYLIGVAFVFYETFWILSPRVMFEESTKMKLKIKKHRGKKWDDFPIELKEYIKTKGIANFIFTIWAFLGLFTWNWFLFFIFLAFNLVFVGRLDAFLRFRFPTISMALMWINSVIGFAIGTFAIINTYHLKINVYALFLQWFNSL